VSWILGLSLSMETSLVSIIPKSSQYVNAPSTFPGAPTSGEDHNRRNEPFLGELIHLEQDDNCRKRGGQASNCLSTHPHGMFCLNSWQLLFLLDVDIVLPSSRSHQISAFPGRLPVLGRSPPLLVSSQCAHPHVSRSAHQGTHQASVHL